MDSLRMEFRTGGPIKDLFYSLYTPIQADLFALSTWAKKPTKFADLLWKLRWGLCSSGGELLSLIHAYYVEKWSKQ